MSLHSISNRNTHTIPSDTAFNPTNIRRSSFSDFSSRITLASGPNENLLQKLFDLCWQAWLKVRIYFRTLCILPSTTRSEVVAFSQEAARFKTRMENCPVSNRDMKVQLERDFQRLPPTVRDQFTHLSSHVLLQFAQENDPQKARKMQQRVVGEVNYMLNLYPKLHFLTGVRARSPVVTPGPNPGPNPNPPPNSPFAGTPFANRIARIPEQANEPTELRIGQ